MTARIAVVGGGLAGIAAALECADVGRVGDAVREPARGSAARRSRSSATAAGSTTASTSRFAAAPRTSASSSGSASADLASVQRRLRVPVLREGKPPAFISRNGLPAPLHLGHSLLRYSPLSVRERLAALRAALALRKLDPDDPALDEQTFGDWLRAHGQSPAAIEALWNLIALPTLNLHADEARSRSRRRSSAPASSTGRRAPTSAVPTVPLQRLHGDAAAAALERAGVARRARHAGRAVGRGHGELQLDDGAHEADAVVVAVPHQAVAKLVPPGVVDADALEALGASPIVNLHVHYDRRVLDEPFAPGSGRRVQWLFDRTGSSGVAGGQLVAVSLSGARRGHRRAASRRCASATSRRSNASCRPRAARRCSTSP